MSKIMPAGLAWLMLSALLALSACTATTVDKETPDEPEQLLLDYIRREQTGEYGMYTNRLETSQTEEAASGHEVLSESAGLMLRYYAARSDREAFKAAWKQAKKVFDRERDGGFSYRFSPKLNKLYDANAAVDDLRIIRALLEGADVFQSADYRKEAQRYGRRLLRHNAPDGHLYDFYDEQYKRTNDFLTLCYADLRTLRLLAADNKEAGAAADELLDIVQGGYVSDAFPFYEARYDYGSKRYDTKQVNMVESLLTVLHLAEIGAQRESSVEAIRTYVRSGELYGQYSLDGKPLNDIRSTALYAIAAMIGAEIGDRSLYADAIARMSEFQIRDESSALYGGFGDRETGQAYSFDNLTALLAYSMKEDTGDEGGHP